MLPKDFEFKECNIMQVNMNTNMQCENITTMVIKNINDSKIKNDE